MIRSKKNYPSSADFANIILKIRNDYNLTQKQLADLIKVSDRTISKWENGQTIPDLVNIQNICETLHISPSYLIYSKKTFKDRIHIISDKIGRIINYSFKHIFNICFMIVFIILLLYFLNNYNAISLYKVKYSSDNIEIENGYFIKNKSVNILVLNNIELVKKNHDPKSIKLELYTYVGGDKYILYTADDLDDIYIEELSAYPVVFTKYAIDGMKRNLYLDIYVTNKENKETVYNSIINLSKIFVNNKLSYDKFPNNEKLDNDYKAYIFQKLPSFEAPLDIKNDFSINKVGVVANSSYVNLEKLGYKYDSNTFTYSKLDENHGTIEYNTYSHLITYTINNDKYKMLFNYNLDSCIIKGYDIDNNNLNIIEYLVKANYCLIGDCQKYMNEINYILGQYEEILATL